MSSEEVGRGGYGTVKRKGLQCTKAIEEHNLTSALREINDIYRLDSPHVIKINSVSHRDDKIYISMPCVGKSLENMLPIPDKFILNMVEQLLRVVDYIHSQGIWHRDIKPHNLVLSETGHLTLIDFGASKDFLHPSIHTPRMTTYWLAAPEMLAQPKSYTSRVDEWSVGLTIYAMVMGWYLIQGDTELAVLTAIFRRFGTPTPEQLVEMGIDPNFTKYPGSPLKLPNKKLERICAGLLKPYPKDRISCAEAYKILFNKDLPTYRIRYVEPRYPPGLGIKYRHREILVDWLCDVIKASNLDLYTLVNTMAVIDSYVSQVPTTTKEYQLIAIVALFLVDRLRYIHLNMLICIDLADGAYTEKQFEDKMYSILATLNYRINLPIKVDIDMFLDRPTSNPFLPILTFLLFSQYLTDISWRQVNRLIRLFNSAWQTGKNDFGPYAATVAVLRPLMLKYSPITRNPEAMKWVSRL